jgi:molybdenum cofactor cytidylyltransferase
MSDRKEAMSGLTGPARQMEPFGMVATVHILILAAGASSRMRGADKLTQPVWGRPLLRHVAEVALATGGPVTVTLPPDAAARMATLDGLDLRTVTVPDAARGMSRSIIRGVQALVPAAGPRDGLMILPADMPAFTTPALSGMIAAFHADPTRILRGGTADGQPGHPAIFPRDLWPALMALAGDEGGRSVLQQEKGRVRVIPLPGPMAVLDLDTPEDWAAWNGN